ncbi:MAG: two-component sensor histidine kinase, partial [Eubacteriales bacterium]|nr:two-component sensor histidine kinase [Eubacteriales bacterium]
VQIDIGLEGKRPRFTVADTGVGISEEHQSRVFERFYRVDMSRSKDTGGTGLGLSIVKHGAQLHHAEITLKSKPGAGTTIILLFPEQKESA